MNLSFEEFVNAISFSSIQPESQVTPDQLCGSFLPPNFDQSIMRDLENTRLPVDDVLIKKKLNPLLQMPRMSSFAVGAIIHYGVSRMSSDEIYLNIGTWHGFSLFAGMLNNPDKTCVGVDNFSEFSGHVDSYGGVFPPVPIHFYKRFNQYRTEKHHFHEMDYQEYFKEIHQGKIGFYFYDGEHSYKNQLEGLRAAEPFFAEECVILVDDTNEEDPRKATLDFIAGSKNKYKTLLDKKTACVGHPTFWNGLMVLQRNW